MVRPAATSAALPVMLTGTVVAQVRVNVRAEASGRIVWVSPKFRDGGTLAADEVIVRIDPQGARQIGQEKVPSVSGPKADGLTRG